MRKFSYNEIVFLNQFMSFRSFIPIYAAANDGIYRMNRVKIIKGFIAEIATLGIVFGIMFLAMIGIVFLAAIAISEIYSLVSRSLHASLSYSTNWIPALIGILTGVGLIAGSVYGLIKYVMIKLIVKIGKMFGITANELEGELVVSWSQVKTITVVKVKRIVTATGGDEDDMARIVFITIGDWHVLTIDGRDIKIPSVDDPHNKLNYVKNRFNLNFS
jgi:hypothetical protein